MMPSKKVIDYTDVAWPFNLLKSYRSVKQMESGEKIEILISDADVLKSLILVIDQSPGYCFTYIEENEAYRLAVKKNR